MLSFDFLDKGLEIVSPAHFVYDFLTKMWLLLKPGPGSWTRTLKTQDPEKPGINIGLKNMSDFRELSFIKTMRNVIYCLKVRVLTDI